MRHRDQAILSLELCRANYSFFVVSHMFSIHDGIKFQLSRKDILTVASLITDSKIITQKYYDYLNAKYPQRKYICSKGKEDRLLIDLPFLY